MYNSHQDPNFSLALNIIDGCWQVQSIYKQKTKIGQDVTADNAQEMFRCAYQLASQMHKEAISGFYFELAPALYLMQQNAVIPTTEERYFDPVRRLSLLPQFAVKRITAGQWKLPFNKEYIGEMRERVYAKPSPHMCPLSYTQEDRIWLIYQDDDRAVDVFRNLKESLYELLADAIEGQAHFQVPNHLPSPERWLKQQFMDGNYEVPATLYLLHFFPYRCSQIIATRPTVNVRYILNALGADKPTGDAFETMQGMFLPLLKYGAFSIRLWIERFNEEGR